jgi:hypothetical protein
MVQVVDHLPSKHEALSSNCTTTKEGERKMLITLIQSLYTIHMYELTALYSINMYNYYINNNKIFSRKSSTCYQ